MVKYEPIYETKICPICNEEYTLNVAIKRNREKKTCGKQKYASKYGNLNAKKVKVNCKICNTEFELSHFNVQKEGNYCSDECRKKRHQANSIVCGKLYFTDRLGTKYCSEECNAIGVKNQLKKQYVLVVEKHSLDHRILYLVIKDTFVLKDALNGNSLEKIPIDTVVNGGELESVKLKKIITHVIDADCRRMKNTL